MVQNDDDISHLSPCDASRGNQGKVIDRVFRYTQDITRSICDLNDPGVISRDSAVSTPIQECTEVVWCFHRVDIDLISL